jgi:hypothetical protein
VTLALYFLTKTLFISHIELKKFAKKTHREHLALIRKMAVK